MKGWFSLRYRDVLTRKTVESHRVDTTLNLSVTFKALSPEDVQKMMEEERRRMRRDVMYN